MENLQKERQISVDPISTKESGKPSLGAPGSPNEYGMPSLPLPPGKSRFLSYRLPGSAASSPRYSSAAPNKVFKNQVANPLAHQHSVALSCLVQLRENHMRRSKSLGERRASAPNDEFDLWLTKPAAAATANLKCEMLHNRKTGRKCWILVMTISNVAQCACSYPGFGKGKPVRSSRKETQTPSKKPHVISRIVFAFEKDRKGVLKSRSVARGMGRKSHESSRHVRFSTSSASNPTTPSLCITPRLQNAMEEFNAFIEAQSA